MPKFVYGAWVPIAIAAVISLTTITWLTGRRSVARALHILAEGRQSKG